VGYILESFEAAVNAAFRTKQPTDIRSKYQNFEFCETL
jgi:hypothetical protein